MVAYHLMKKTKGRRHTRRAKKKKMEKIKHSKNRKSEANENPVTLDMKIFPPFSLLRIPTDLPSVAAERKHS